VMQPCEGGEDMKPSKTTEEQVLKDEARFRAIPLNESRAIIAQVSKFWPLAGNLKPEEEPETSDATSTPTP